MQCLIIYRKTVAQQHVLERVLFTHVNFINKNIIFGALTNIVYLYTDNSISSSLILKQLVLTLPIMRSDFRIALNISQGSQKKNTQVRQNKKLQICIS